MPAGGRGGSLAREGRRGRRPLQMCGDVTAALNVRPAPARASLLREVARRSRDGGSCRQRWLRSDPSKTVYAKGLLILPQSPFGDSSLKREPKRAAAQAHVCGSPMVQTPKTNGADAQWRAANKKPPLRLSRGGKRCLGVYYNVRGIRQTHVHQKES